MNTYETSLIEKKLDQNNQFIKAQHRLPKSERNQRDINEAKQKVKTFNKWLNNK